MQRVRVAILATVIAFGSLAVGAAEANDTVRHDLDVRLSPAAHRIEVVDRIELPRARHAGSVRFALHAGLEPSLDDDALTIRRLPGDPDPVTLGLPVGLDPFPGDLPVEIWEVTAEPGRVIDGFKLRYAGVVHHPIREVEEEYARAFGETPGTIQEEGVFLGSSTFWYPWFGEELLTFSMRVETPLGWEAVSEGERTSHETTASSVRVEWNEPNPLEEIHLVAGPWKLYEGDRANRVATYVYLREEDPGLARTLLDTAAQYVTMYEKLLGPYPFAKFAAVENFWETGYGMPSFTLLGPRVIRFPFILHSSYPHEILHNWWGNGVYVEWGLGNWCEGLTAYLADHLVKEQRGQGAGYRRDLLQKYADYVRDGLDFPLTEFRSRHSSATQAVGYGKTAMTFHMLRRKLGDEAFVAGLQRLYKDGKFARMSWAEVRDAFAAVSEQDLMSFFDTWVTREGAPALRLEGVRAEELPEGGWALRFGIEQTQEVKPFPLDVPVTITLDDGEIVAETVTMAGRRSTRALTLDARPVHVAVDPEFDLFRRLDVTEIPPSFGRAFGAEKVTVVLPSAATGALATGYAELAAGWSKTGSGEVEVVGDSDLEALPSDRAVWIFGAENRFVDEAASAAAPFGGKLTASKLAVGSQSFGSDSASITVAATHPDDPRLAIAFLSANRAEALPGLGRKLPHYGKYGWLAFEGDEPENVGKGQWDAVGSPLAVAIDDGGTGGASPARDALATLPPPFSAGKMLSLAKALAHPGRVEGRGCGSRGLATAANILEAAFRGSGLSPGWGGGYRQTFTASCEEGETELVNIIGEISGTDEKLGGHPVVVMAHYDHLGLGWPDAREREAGKIHPGADDNASGVAVLVELARVLADLRPKRTILFVATSGEESGLQGSRAFVAATSPHAPAQAIGALNLDTVGRLDDGKILVLGSGSADEWVHIVRGAGWVTGVPAEAVRDDPGGSDQVAFLDAGVPAVQFFTGPHADYHRSSDTVDKLDIDGMVDVATFVSEFVTYLADREEPLTSRLAGATARPAATGAARTGRRVSLGTVPDFSWQEGGYRLDGVTPGSPAEKAGLAAGDIIVRIDETAIEGLRDLSNALKSKEPGDRFIANPQLPPSPYSAGACVGR
jgi:hypothetical protein